MEHHLSRDELDALEQVSQAKKLTKPSACIARNSKKLVGIKYLMHRKDGSFALTEKGAQALFVKKCIAGLRAVAIDPNSKLDVAVATFLVRKSQIVASEIAGQYELTQKGRECLADMALNP